ALISASGIGVGSRVLDIGWGSGEFIEQLEDAGAMAAGIDPAPAMLDIARRRSPAADIRLGTAEALPWPDDTFDVVTAVNSLQFADDTLGALAEAIRVTVPGGIIAVSNWAEGGLNDLNTIEAAVSDANGEALKPDGDLRQPGGLEVLLRDGGCNVVASGLVDVPWEAPGDDAIVAGVLLGESAETVVELGAVVIAAARPFRTPSGGYRLTNRFRYAIGRVPT
ncbi:MAG TPA: class I SAM-dependent methyltransferase, partial [Homoserinimonas sp.]|nr:class I SAM-dependent methyltransferase [Homoserinimonas sp.]